MVYVVLPDGSVARQAEVAASVSDGTYEGAKPPVYGD